jgi:hypothetical protein
LVTVNTKGDYSQINDTLKIPVPHHQKSTRNTAKTKTPSTCSTTMLQGTVGSDSVSDDKRKAVDHVTP